MSVSQSSCWLLCLSFAANAGAQQSASTGLEMHAENDSPRSAYIVDARTDAERETLSFLKKHLLENALPGPELIEAKTQQLQKARELSGTQAKIDYFQKQIQTQTETNQKSRETIAQLTPIREALSVANAQSWTDQANGEAEILAAQAQLESKKAAADAEIVYRDADYQTASQNLLAAVHVNFQPTLWQQWRTTDQQRADAVTAAQAQRKKIYDAKFAALIKKEVAALADARVRAKKQNDLDAVAVTTATENYNAISERLSTAKVELNEGTIPLLEQKLSEFKESAAQQRQELGLLDQQVAALTQQITDSNVMSSERAVLGFISVSPKKLEDLDHVTAFTLTALKTPSLAYQGSALLSFVEDDNGNVQQLRLFSKDRRVNVDDLLYRPMLKFQNSWFDLAIFLKLYSAELQKLRGYVLAQATLAQLPFFAKSLNFQSTAQILFGKTPVIYAPQLKLATKTQTTIQSAISLINVRAVEVPYEVPALKALYQSMLQDKWGDSTLLLSSMPLDELADHSDLVEDALNNFQISENRHFH